MNAKFLFAAVAVAAAFTGVAQADEADGSQYAIQFQGTRTRAEVQAEAALVAKNRNPEPAGSRVIEAPRSQLDAKTVRAEAVQALRDGKIPHGELSL
jgi:hypothetical protein